MSESPESTLTAEETTKAERKRANMVVGLRELADLLEQNPGLPLPYRIAVDCFVEADELKVAAKAMPGRADKDAVGSYFELRKTLGEGEVAYAVNTPREEVCTRRQVGTRQVAEQKYVETGEMIDEPVYEWECPDSLLAGDDR